VVPCTNGNALQFRMASAAAQQKRRR